MPVQFRWVAKKSLFNVPFMGWHMSRAGYVAIDRDNPRQAAKSIIEAASIIRHGNNVIAFPEGRRSGTGDLGDFIVAYLRWLCVPTLRWCLSA
jgi:1-acyl-sn-glycerol-3-phosphate acyltransferase